MACFPPVDGSPSFPDFHDTIPPSQNTMHQISEDRALEDLKRLMSEFFGNEEPSCQSEAQLDEPYLENSSHDVAPSFDSLLPASCSQQFAQDMAFTDLFLSQSGNVRREDTSATPVNYPEVPLAEGMLAGSKRSYDAIDNEDYIERDHDEEVKDGVFDTVLPTASVSQIPSNAVAFHNDDFSHYAAGQQSQFYYTGANQVVPLIGSASADNGSNSMIGPSHLDMVYPTRPHSEPVAPSNYDATGPQAGSGTMPLVPKSPYIKLPQLLRLNPASGHVSDNKQDHPVELGPLQSQYKATTHYSIHRRTQSMPAPGNVYPYPPNTHATPILPDNNNQAYFSHQFKPATAGQQIFANPVNHQAYAPYKLQPPTSGVPQMNAYSHCNIRSGPRVIRLPNCQSQVHYQQVPPVFTFTFPVPRAANIGMVSTGGPHLENGVKNHKPIFPPPASMFPALPGGVANSQPVQSPPAPVASTFATSGRGRGRGRGRNTDEHPNYIVRIKDGVCPCKIPGCSTTFAAEHTTKGRVQSHLNAAHYRGLDINEKSRCLWPGCGQDATKRSSHGRHISEIHFGVIKYECRLCGQLCTRPDKVLEHLEGACSYSPNKKQRIN